LDKGFRRKKFDTAKSNYYEWVIRVTPEYSS